MRITCIAGFDGRLEANTRREDRADCKKLQSATNRYSFKTLSAAALDRAHKAQSLKSVGQCEGCGIANQSELLGSFGMEIVGSETRNLDQPGPVLNDYVFRACTDKPLISQRLECPVEVNW